MDDQHQITVMGDEKEAMISFREKLQRLYSEAQALKMSGIRKFLALAGKDVPESEAQKISAEMIKAIQLQLRILALEQRDERGAQWPESLEVIWDEFMKNPEMRAILNREKFRRRLIEGLKARAARE
jgi:hypothetical protein